MKPQELSRKTPDHYSFSVSKHRLSHFLNVWHYHDELELIYVHKSTGTKFIGDSIEKFKEGDLVLIGAQLPHLWLNDSSYFEDPELYAEAWVVHFHRNCFGDQFFEIPELSKINSVIENSRIGIKIEGHNRSKITEQFQKLLVSHDHEKVLLLLNMLKLIAEDDKVRTLSSHTFIDSHSSASGSRLDTVYEHVFNNFKRNIQLDEISDLVNMNTSSFSRYFKQVTNKTFTEFLNEIRVGYACKLILEQDKMNIAQIGFESGYNNLSHFNKQFKTVTGMTPTDYYNAYRNPQASTVN